MAGSYWLLNRGVHPESLQIEPLTHTYDEMIETLENLGYHQGKDLFVANYDWRLAPGPIRSLTTSSITRSTTWATGCGRP